MKRNYIILLLVILGGLNLFTLSSCNKDLDIPSTMVSGDKAHWTSLDDVRSGVIGMYGLLRAALVDHESYWLRGDLRSGDFTSYSSPDLKAIIQGKLNARYPLIQDAANWRRFYAVINACNLFIKKSGKALVDERYTKTNHKIDVAQARAIRAFTYFLLVRTWGDVPLTVEPNGGAFPKVRRTSKDTVLNFAEKELRAVAPSLPYLYGTDDDPIQTGNYYGYNVGRYISTLFSKLAIYAMLAHIAAWRGDYLGVITYTNPIMNNYTKSNMSYMTTNELTSSTGFFFERDYNQLIGFNALSGHGEQSTTGHIENLTLAEPLTPRKFPQIYVTKDSILNIFPEKNGNDERFGFDTLSHLPYETYFTNYREEIPIFSKVKCVTGGKETGGFARYVSTLVFTRLEEITLLRAEAFAVLNRPGDAIPLLNIIKKKRGIKPYKKDTSEDLLTAIFAERRRELMGEGWRWWDQVRYHRIKRDNPTFNNLIDNGGIYWPIADAVLESNPLLVQNKYWREK